MSKLDDVTKVIMKEQKKLILQVREHGVPENFGRREIRAIEDRFHFTLLCYSDNPVEKEMAKRIEAFREWCYNYVND